MSVSNKAMQLFLNINAMEPGDIVLSRGRGKLSGLIAQFGGGEFSHAAIYAGACHMVEALRDGLAPTAMPIERTEIYEPTDKELMNTSLGELRMKDKCLCSLPDTSIVTVKRHPGMKNALRPYPGRPEDAIMSVTKDLWFREYPNATALAGAVWTSAFKTWLAKHALEVFEWFEEARVIPGPFCSELVMYVMNHLELKLFDEELEPNQISPSRISESPFLVDVPEARASVNPDAKVLVYDDPFENLVRQRGRRYYATIGVPWKIQTEKTNELRRELRSLNKKLRKQNEEFLRRLEKGLRENRDEKS